MTFPIPNEIINEVKEWEQNNPKESEEFKQEFDKWIKEKKIELDKRNRKIKNRKW